MADDTIYHNIYAQPTFTLLQIIIQFYLQILGGGQLANPPHQHFRQSVVDVFGFIERFLVIRDAVFGGIILTAVSQVQEIRQRYWFLIHYHSIQKLDGLVFQTIGKFLQTIGAFAQNMVVSPADVTTEHTRD